MDAVLQSRDDNTASVSSQGREQLPLVSGRLPTPAETPLLYQFYTHEEPVHMSWAHRLIRRLWPKPREQRPMAQESAYFALVPLTDSRLSPARTRAILAVLGGIALIFMVATFLLVPRGVSVGNIQVTVEEMAWSADSGTYELDLSMSLPVFNPNFLPVRLHGDLQVMFYTSTAGSTKLEAVVPSRSLPYNETVHVNAGRLDQRFLWTVLNQCASFPHTLIFLLEGHLTLTTWFGTTASLPDIDTYFFVPCQNDN